MYTQWRRIELARTPQQQQQCTTAALPLHPPPRYDADAIIAICLIFKMGSPFGPTFLSYSERKIDADCTLGTTIHTAILWMTPRF